MSELKKTPAVKYTGFQRFWNGKLFLVYFAYPDLFLWEIIEVMADLEVRRPQAKLVSFRL